MAQCKTCEFCGANLDYGEKCDCTKKEVGVQRQLTRPPKGNYIIILPQEKADVKSGGKSYGD